MMQGPENHTVAESKESPPSKGKGTFLEQLQHILAELRAPSDFKGDPYGAATNQAGHVLIGMGMGYVSTLFLQLEGITPAALVFCAYYVFWEFVAQGGGRPRYDWDSVTDALFVGGGALLVSYGGVAFASATWTLYAGLLFALALEAFRRA